MEKFQKLQDENFEWAEKQFGSDRLLATLKHLRSEVDELIESPKDITEYADAFLLLIQAARIAGITMVMLLEAAWKKFRINKKRNWGKPNEDGYSEHIN